MNNKSYKAYCTVALIFIFIIMALVAGHSCQGTNDVKPQPTIKQQVLTYPFRDNSPTLRAAEKKVGQKIQKVETDYCSRHMQTDPRCGAWVSVNGKWEKVK
jgi:hypothetical protein